MPLSDTTKVSKFLLQAKTYLAIAISVIAAVLVLAYQAAPSAPGTPATPDAGSDSGPASS